MDPSSVAVGVGAGSGTALLVYLAKHVFAKMDSGVSKQGEAVQGIQITVSAIAQEMKFLTNQLAELRGELRGDTRARAELEALVKVQASRLDALAGEVKDQGAMLREATVLRLTEARNRRDEACRTTSSG